MPAPDDDVPRLPRGRGLKLDTAMLVRIAMTLALLVMVIVSARPCANATSKFVTGFGEEGSASSTMPKPGTVDEPAADEGSAYESLRSDMSEAELKAAIERARQKAAGSGAGSGAAGAGSAAGSARAP